MFAATATNAHHGWSSYENHQLLTVSGFIAEVSYTYPHASIRLKAVERTWRIVLAAPARMYLRGLPGNSLRVGDTATVEGYASRRDPDELRAERITLGSKTVELR